MMTDINGFRRACASYQCLALASIGLDDEAETGSEVPYFVRPKAKRGNDKGPSPVPLGNSL